MPPVCPWRSCAACPVLPRVVSAVSTSPMAPHERRGPGMAETSGGTEAALRCVLWGLNPAPGSARSRSARSCPRTAAGGCRLCAACRCALERGHAATDRLDDRSRRRDKRHMQPRTAEPMLPRKLGGPTGRRRPDHDVSMTAGHRRRSVGDNRSTQAIRPALQAGHRPRLSSTAADPTSPNDSSPVVVAS